MKKYINILIATLFTLTACTHMQKVVDENVTGPVLLNKPRLVYPPSSQQNSRHGTSVIIFSISKEGEVEQTHVHRSSGFKDLDNAAENYCKGLTFTPAKENGESISSSMKWSVIFNLEENNNEISKKIAQVNSLYSKADRLAGLGKFNTQKEILRLHEDITKNMRDVFQFNEYVYGVVQNDLQNEWKSFSQTYPLSFLLYHDFILRFADYDSLEAVNYLFEQAINQDLEYISITSSSSTVNKRNDEKLISKVKEFVSNNYPSIKVNSLEGKNKVMNGSLSEANYK